jgi:hypothetical protein
MKPESHNLRSMSVEEVHNSLMTTAQLVRPHSPEELEQILKWADEVLMRFSILDLVIAGALVVQVLEGEVKFEASDSGGVSRGEES